jgi:hypothetical protein
MVLQVGQTYRITHATRGTIDATVTEVGTGGYMTTIDGRPRQWLDASRIRAAVVVAPAKGRAARAGRRGPKEGG